MKKLFLSLSALVILGLPKLLAQLPNAGFNNWSADPLVATAKQPNTGNGTSGWWGFNFDNSPLLGSSPITVYEGTVSPAPEEGSAYAEIVSAGMSNSTYTTLTGYGFPYPDTNGLVVTAYINASFSGLKFIPGVPWTGGRSPKFSFYYRYKPNGGSGHDTCSCTVAMYHWNTDEPHPSRELIGGGYWENDTVTRNWTKVTVPITYDSASVPDTIYVAFSACSIYTHGKPKAGDTLDIDNSGAVLGVGNINEQHDNVNLYPNPANTAVNLAVSGQFNAANVEIYDITGRSVGTYPIRNNFVTINTQSYTSGMYIYKLLSDSGTQLNIGKFNVSK